MANAKQEIKEILLDPAFQPREESRDIKEEVLRYLADKIAPLWNAIRESLSKSLNDSGAKLSIPDWLQEVILFFYNWGFLFLKLTALAFVLLLAGREIIKLLKKKKDSEIPISTRKPTFEVEEPIEPFLQRGEFLEYLIRLRRKLRRQILHNSNRPPSIPDRALLQVLNSSDIESFKETAVCYEKVVLAGGTINPDEIRRLSRMQGAA